jgi:hypothetical protein
MNRETPGVFRIDALMADSFNSKPRVSSITGIIYRNLWRLRDARMSYGLRK